MTVAGNRLLRRSDPDTLANDIRRLVIERSYVARVGHIGSALSPAEILAVLHGSIMRGDAQDPDRDRFILSKGHAALALYAALALTGRLAASELETFGTPGSHLGVHPEPTIAGIDFGTGSLGQGLAMGAGAALAARLQSRKSRTFVLMSDGELNEGAVWETVMFAAHHKLRNLVAVIDLNGQQAFGATTEVVGIPDLAGAFTAFGWEVRQVDGHDQLELADALDVRESAGAPRVVIARTVFAKGVSFMEGKLEWHYLPLDDEQYERALEELQR